MTEPNSTKPARVVNFSDFAAGNTDGKAFRSWGYAYLKVTKGDDLMAVRLKITSVPHDEVEKLRKDAPRPPSVARMIDPNQQREEAQALGITQRQKVIMPDYSNTDYLDALRDYNLHFNAEVVGRGIDETVSFPDGRAAETPEQRYQALMAHGLALTHIAEMSTEIMKLTDWADEERAGFLHDGSGSNSAPGATSSASRKATRSNPATA